MFLQLISTYFFDFVFDFLYIYSNKQETIFKNISLHLTLFGLPIPGYFVMFIIENPSFINLSKLYYSDRVIPQIMLNGFLAVFPLNFLVTTYFKHWLLLRHVATINNQIVAQWLLYFYQTNFLRMNIRIP